MTLSLFLLIYAIIHIIICVVIHICIRTRILKFSEQLMPIVIFVPVAGVISAVIADIISRSKKTGTRDITLEKMHLDDDDLRLQQLSPNEEESIVIPLEEAMSINDAKTRRLLMLDILRQRPDQYTELLHQACTDTDIEVSHYASTAIMELQRDYEFAVQKCEKKYRQDESDAVVRDQYIENLKRYIDSGLIDKNILFVYRNRYAEILNAKIKDQPEDMDAVLCAIDNYMALNNYNEAERLADLAIMKWPNREDVWLSKLTVCEETNNGEGIKNVIFEIKRRNVYLSKRGRNAMAFWDRTENQEVTV